MAEAERVVASWLDLALFTFTSNLFRILNNQHLMLFYYLNDSCMAKTCLIHLFMRFLYSTRQDYLTVCDKWDMDSKAHNTVQSNFAQTPSIKY